MNYKRILILVLIMVIALPITVFAKIDGGSFPSFRVSNEYDIEVDKGSSGNFPMKTSTGSTKFLPSYGEGNTIRDVVFKKVGEGGLNTGSPNYLMVTHGDGYSYRVNGVNGDIVLDDFHLGLHPTKSLSIVVHSDGSEYISLHLRAIDFNGTGGGGGTDPGNGGDNGGGGGGGGGGQSGQPLGIVYIINMGDGSDQHFEWGALPSGTYELVCTYPNGQKVSLLPSVKRLNVPPGVGGLYTFQAKDMNGNVLGTFSYPVGDSGGTDPGGTDPGGTNPGGTDPGGGGGGEEECSAGCQALKDALECPDFDQYLGKWADMIRSTYPPPPDWQYVASVMRDTIVPAMGQEIVNRSPEIARIIADEFQSREKAVSPPPALPSFTPSVPRVQDNAKVTGDLTSNVPSFTPDYSQDKPFEILDPGKLEFKDNSDQGYQYNVDNAKPPDYKPGGKEPSVSDPGYNGKETEDPQPPAYEYNPAASKPAPDYKTEETPEEEPPDYKTGEEHTGDYRNYKYQQEGPQPDYNGK